MIMKKSIALLFLALCPSVIPLHARIWTSADGQKTFEGEYRAYDEATGMVKVLRGIRQISFHVDKLSAADREWLEQKAAEENLEQVDDQAADLAELDNQVVGGKLKEGVLSKLEGGKFVDYTMDYVPEYYVVYYSASW